MLRLKITQNEFPKELQMRFGTQTLLKETRAVASKAVIAKYLGIAEN